MKTPILETERLILRPLRIDDASDVFEWASDDRVTKFMIYPTHKSIETTLEWLKSLDHDSETDYDFGFVEKESGKLIGSGGLYWEAENSQWRIGYNLRFDRWRMGYATEAALAMVKFAREDLNAERIGSMHAVNNPHSGRVMINCGLVFVKYGTYTKYDNSVAFRCKEYLWTKSGEELTHHKGTVTLRTERLILRTFKESDYKDIYTWASNPKVTRYLSYPTHQSIETSKEIAKVWEKASESKKNYNWAIEYGGKVIGNISVVNHDDLWEAGMGWQIDVSYWNQGIMTEAAHAVFEFLFEEVGFHRIYSGHDTRNPGSERVMEKLGMKKEGIFPQMYYKKGFGTGDSQKYAILKEEWIEQKENAQI